MLTTGLKMFNKLAELASELDKRGYAQQADQIDELIKTLIADTNFSDLQLESLAEEKAACEMCGEFKSLTKEETNDGDTWMLCKQCKKDYGKK